MPMNLQDWITQYGGTNNPATGNRWYTNEIIANSGLSPDMVQSYADQYNNLLGQKLNPNDPINYAANYQNRDWYKNLTGQGLNPLTGQGVNPVTQPTNITTGYTPTRTIAGTSGQPTRTGGILGQSVSPNVAANYWNNTNVPHQLGSALGQTGSAANNLQTRPATTTQNRTISTPRTGTATTSTAYNPSTVPATNYFGTSALPTLQTGSTTGYNPTAYTPAQTGGGGFLNTSGGFAYDQLPGMMNYLMQYLSGNMNQASGTESALTDFMGQNITSGYPGGMSQYLQEMVNMLGSPQASYGQTQQAGAADLATALAGGTTPQTALQTQVGDTISQMLTGSGLTPEYVEAMRQSVLAPSQENLVGQLNRMGGGVTAPASGLQQELTRRNEEAFNNQLIQQGYQNYNNLLNQGLATGATTFGQGLNLAGLQGNLGQNAIQNALGTMTQGGNLLNQYLGAGLGLQGNQQQYATNLANQYGNLTGNYLNAYTANQAIQNQNQQASNASTGSGIAGLLGALLGTGGTGGTAGSSTNLPIQSIINGVKKLFGIGGNQEADAAINESLTNPDTSISNIVSGIPTGGGWGDLTGINADDLWNYLGLPSDVNMGGTQYQQDWNQWQQPFDINSYLNQGQSDMIPYNYNWEPEQDYYFSMYDPYSIINNLGYGYETGD